ncbi:TPA: helix-turn-helix domain-containing protein [Proteus mirabilis]
MNANINNTLKFKNIIFSNHTLLLVRKNNKVSIAKENIKYHINSDSIVFIKKDSALDITLQKNQVPNFIFLSHEIIMEILKITINNKKEEITRTCNKDSFIKQAHHEDILFFNRLKNQFNDEIITANKTSLSQTLKIAYLLLHFDIPNLILKSKPELTSVKVKNIIISDLQHSWSLREISSKLFISESSLRKKLEAEKTNFMTLLTTVRMAHAMHLLATTNLTIGQISSLSGYKNTSYFIKKFKKYYKSSPKKLKCLKL